MEEFKLSEIEELKIIYKEIINGYSFSFKEKIYFRHLTEIENIELLIKKKEFILKYINDGIPYEKERLKMMIENGEWSQDQEDQIVSLRYIISDNEKNIVNIIAQQQDFIKKAIESDKEKLTRILIQKHGLLGSTAEGLSNEDVNHYTAYLCSFKDPSCKVPLFSSWEEFDSLGELEMSGILEAMNKELDKFSEENLRKIASLPLFINALSYSKENIHTFLGGPISSLTSFQLFILSLGSRNLNVLSQTATSPPELIGDTKIEEIVTWYDQQYSILLGKRNQK